jgi:hypothetical protein
VAGGAPVDKAVRGGGVRCSDGSQSCRTSKTSSGLLAWMCTFTMLPPSFAGAPTQAMESPMPTRVRCVSMFLD